MKLRFSTRVSVIALLVAPGVPAFAQESAGPPRTMQNPGPGTPPTPGSTEATSAQTQGLEDIVVTAQRREESAQRSALAITAVSGAQLQARGVTSADSIGRLTPGLQVTPSTGPYATFTVRGITSLSGNAFADPSVAVNINGVYLASPVTIRGLFYDLDRVEVLEGPQGTLYGRNATAGAINIIPKRPTFEFGGQVGADIGNYGRFNFDAALNAPLSDTVAVRLSGQRAKHDGYFSDGSGDEDVQALRGQLLFNPTSSLSILLSGDYSHEGGKGTGATLYKRCASLSPPRSGGIDGNCFVGATPFTAVSDLTGEYARFGFQAEPKDLYNDSNYYGAALNADLTTGLGTFTFIGGYRDSDVNWKSSASSWQFSAHDKPKEYSTELRLASGKGSRLQYVFGLYYLNTVNHSHQFGENEASVNFSDQFNNLYGSTEAAFSQLTFAVIPTVRLVGGLRYTHEYKRSDSRRYVLNGLVGPDPVLPDAEPTNLVPTTLYASKTFDRVNWKAGVEWDVAPHSLFYGNVSTGFKAGGFFYGAAVAQTTSTGTVNNSCAVNCTFAPESVTSYNIGSKNRFLHNRLQLNLELFYVNYQDQQVSISKFQTLPNGTITSVLVTDNAGKSRNYGAEVETDYLLTPTTRIGAQIQYLNSKYLKFSYLTSTASAPPTGSACTITPATAGQVTVDCTGQRALRTPAWRVLGSIQQSVPLASGARVIGEANARYESSFYADPSYVPDTRTYATARLDLSVAYNAPSDRFSIKAYVDNVTNVVTIASLNANNSYARTLIPAAGPSMLVGANLAPPRTFGVRGQFRF
jgi:iron complex outermembrane receptor protein